MPKSMFGLVRIGNSRGVCLPAEALERYRIGTTVILEERSHGILFRPMTPPIAKPSWEQTTIEMAVAEEDWPPG